MTDPLLAATIDNPTDAARLVYSDWLEEHGEPKLAQTIRKAVAGPISWDDWLEHGDRMTAFFPCVRLRDTPKLLWQAQGDGVLYGFRDGGMAVFYYDKAGHTVNEVIDRLLEKEWPKSRFIYSARRRAPR